MRRGDCFALTCQQNGAAGNFLCPADALSVNAFRTVQEIDNLGTFNMSRAALPELKKAKKSTIVNISATLQYQGTPWQVHASAAKAGIDAQTKGLAVEWGVYGVRVVGIAPGPIAGTVGMAKLAPMPEIEKGIIKANPLRRMGSIDDVANLALFLASPAAGYISGETVVLDGGQWLNPPQHVPEELVAMAAEQIRRRHSRGKRAKL